MKIAYCFCGHMRTWEKCVSAWRDNVFSRAPGDIFIHTWNTRTQPHGSWWNPGGSPHEPLSRQEIQRILETYKPTGYLIEPTMAPAKMPSDIPSRGLFFDTVRIAYESNKRAYAQAKAHGPYDRYFMLRPDIRFTSPLDPSELLYESLHLSRHDDLLRQGWLYDLFWIGPGDLVESTQRWGSEIGCAKLKTHYQEEGFTDFIRREKIPVRLSSLRYEIVRPRLSHIPPQEIGKWKP